MKRPEGPIYIFVNPTSFADVPTYVYTYMYYSEF